MQTLKDLSKKPEKRQIKPAIVYRKQSGFAKAIQIHLELFKFGLKWTHLEFNTFWLLQMHLKFKIVETHALAWVHA